MLIFSSSSWPNNNVIIMILLWSEGNEIIDPIWDEHTVWYSSSWLYDIAIEWDSDGVTTPTHPFSFFIDLCVFSLFFYSLSIDAFNPTTNFTFSGWTILRWTCNADRSRLGKLQQDIFIFCCFIFSINATKIYTARVVIVLLSLLLCDQVNTMITRKKIT